MATANIRMRSLGEGKRENGLTASHYSSRTKGDTGNSKISMSLNVTVICFASCLFYKSSLMRKSFPTAVHFSHTIKKINKKMLTVLSSDSDINHHRH